ncbi:MAG: hypothetical protein ACW99U_12660 [Candidatus Thorarchaeota archaeon]|jgi:hypothetical protein
MKESLACWKNLPKVLEIANHSDLIQQANVVCVTEDLIGDEVDILIDVNPKKMSFRVNGKASGEDYRSWVAFVKKNLDTAEILQLYDLPSGVIRMVGIRNPGFVKVWAVAHWDKHNEEARYVPWDNLDQLCKILRIPKMPQIMKGKPDPKKYQELAYANILGAPKQGLLLIPSERPVKYIRRRNETTTPKSVEESREKNMLLGKSLATEFSRIALDPVTIIDNNLSDVEETCSFVRQDSEYLFLDYVNRCVEEAGLTESEGNEILESALKKRAKLLINDD